jgi:acyl-CoA thioesterase FadM
MLRIRHPQDPELAVEGGYVVVCVKRPQFLATPLPAELIELMREYLPPLTERTEPAGTSAK